ncbi:MAG: PKD domain-containing protein [Crocinitomix sp.]|nr:PKD domain-containing protein [Crocinitomix sp.]
MILQEQSQLPSFEWTQVHEECFPFSEILVDSIRSANSCAVPIFFNTWGRRDGEPMWDSINTFTKMNQRLHIAYDYMADTHSGKLAPIGIGFGHIYNELDHLVTFEDLYTGDGSHPSIYGSYLSACFFYELIFETSADGNTFIPDGLTAEETSYLQNAATHVFTDVDSITVDYTTPIASFSVSFDGPIATYTNTSAHGFEYFWEFGDGETSTDEHPVHEYPDESEYIATLTVTNCGQEDLSVGGIDDTGINDYHQSNLNVFPNPSKGTVTMRFDGTSALEIFTLDGQLYFNEIVNEQKILALPSGVYLVRVNNDMRKLIVL